jgi:hypothetical protein
MDLPLGSSQRSQEDKNRLSAAETEFWYNGLIRAQIAAFILPRYLGTLRSSAPVERSSIADPSTTPPTHAPVHSSANPSVHLSAPSAASPAHTPMHSPANPSVHLSDQPRTFELLEEYVRDNLHTVFKAKQEEKFVYLTSGEWISWYDKLYQALIGVATLGAGFTFTVITSDIAKPRGGIKEEYVRRCVSVSWLLFVASLGCTSFAALFLSVNKSTFIQSFDRGDKWYKGWQGMVIVPTTLLVQLLPLGAFTAAAEVVRSYHQGLGIIVMVFIAGLAPVLFLFWLGQNRCVKLISRTASGTGLTSR